MEQEQQYLYLTTTGRKSGLPREIEIWYTAFDGCYYLIAEQRERAHWVQNLQVNPAVTFRVAGQTYAGSARLLQETNDADLWRMICARFEQKYSWSAGLVVELQLVAD